MSDPFDLVDEPSPGEAVWPAAIPPWLAALNTGQRTAVEALDGPVLVLAGAGTGKTRVLTARLALVMHERLARPWEVLAVTFTNKAAREMRERVSALVGPAAEAVWLGTFHAIAARILRRHAEVLGLSPDFTILDADDQIRLLKQILEAENLDDKRWPARVLAGVIQRWKDRGLTPDKVNVAEAGDLAVGRLLDIYVAYQERMKTLNAVDFGDLLLHNLALFAADPAVLEKYQHQFRYILVDEYQDTNVSQYLWLRLLAQHHSNIACVGDDDQSIYAWRGAEVGNILRFEADFPGATVVRLEQNYRSTPHILGAASQLIAKNEGRLGKTLWTERNDGEKVHVRGVWDGEEEARIVAETIESLMRRKEATPGECAVLVRAGFQTREFEERFLLVGLPYRVIGGPRFYERQEIRDALAYLRVIAQPDDDLAFERIVNRPRRGVGDATVQQLYRHGRARQISLYRAATELVETDEITGRARKSLKELMTSFARWRAMVVGMPHHEIAATVLDESGYTGALQADRSPEAPGRLENLKELVTAMAEFPSLGGFLEHVALVMENVDGAGHDSVSVMTLHASKGLEFDTVFLPGWEEGLFPHPRNMEENGAAGLEEERRLAYVGLTRARRRAMVMFAANRRIHGQWNASIPSRFVEEMPPEHIAVESEPGLWSGARTSAGGGGVAHAATAFRGRRDWAFASTAPPPRDTEPGLVLAPSRGFTTGARVFHQKFGYGKVLAVDDNRLEIAFDKAGVKKVLDSFVVKAEAL